MRARRIKGLEATQAQGRRASKRPMSLKLEQLIPQPRARQETSGADPCQNRQYVSLNLSRRKSNKRPSRSTPSAYDALTGSFPTFTRRARWDEVFTAGLRPVQGRIEQTQR